MSGASLWFEAMAAGSVPRVESAPRASISPFCSMGLVSIRLSPGWSLICRCTGLGAWPIRSGRENGCSNPRLVALRSAGGSLAQKRRIGKFSRSPPADLKATWEPSSTKKKGPPKRAFHQQSCCVRLPATAATTTAAAATRTEATATARTTTAATRTAAAGATGTILRFIDAQLTATHREAVQGFDGLGCLGLRHFDEAETARAASLAISRERHGLDRTVLREQVAHLGFGRRKRQVSNVNLHDFKLSLSLGQGRARPSHDGRLRPLTAGNTVGIVWRAKRARQGRIFDQRVLSPGRLLQPAPGAYKRLKMQGIRRRPARRIARGPVRHHFPGKNCEVGETGVERGSHPFR